MKWLLDKLFENFYETLNLIGFMTIVFAYFSITEWPSSVSEYGIFVGVIIIYFLLSHLIISIHKSKTPSSINNLLTLAPPVLIIHVKALEP